MGDYLIPLHGVRGQGKFAIVSIEDYERATRFRWHLDVQGYPRRCRRLFEGFGKGHIRMHRDLLDLRDGDPREGDHRNRNRLDNRRWNIRIVAPEEQSQNLPAHQDGSSGIRGVSFHKLTGKWRSRVYHDGQQIYLGLFSSKEAAGRAAARCRLDLMSAAVE